MCSKWSSCTHEAMKGMNNNCAFYLVSTPFTSHDCANFLSNSHIFSDSYLWMWFLKLIMSDDLTLLTRHPMKVLYLNWWRFIDPQKLETIRISLFCTHNFVCNIQNFHFIWNIISPHGLTIFFSIKSSLITEISSITFLQNMVDPPVEFLIIFNLLCCGIFCTLHCIGFLHIEQILPHIVVLSFNWKQNLHPFCESIYHFLIIDLYPINPSYWWHHLLTHIQFWVNKFSKPMSLLYWEHSTCIHSLLFLCGHTGPRILGLDPVTFRTR